MSEKVVPFVPFYYVPKKTTQLQKRENIDFKMYPAALRDSDVPREIIESWKTWKNVIRSLRRHHFLWYDFNRLGQIFIAPLY